MFLLVALILAVGLIILALYELRARFGLTLLFVFVGANQFVQNLLAATVSLEVFDRFPASPGSAVLFCSSLFALLLIYLKEDIPTTRRLIYAIVIANLSLLLVVGTIRWGLATGRFTAVGVAADWFRYYDLQTFFIGTILLIVDTLLLLVIYEALLAKASWIALWGRITLTLAAVLSLDALLFATIALGGSVDLLIGNLLGKNLGALLYGTLLWAYVRVEHRQKPRVASGETDVLSIFTYRERVRELEAKGRTLERRHARERRRSEIALAGARLGVWDWNLLTGDTYVDDRWAEMLGYKRHEIPPRIESWQERIHPEDRQSVEQALKDHFKGAKQFYQIAHRLRTKSGHWKWILTMGKVVEWSDDGEPLRLSGTHLDITEQKLVEERLARLEKRYRELFLDAPLMYVITRVRQDRPVIEDCNQVFLETLGFSREEVIGKPLADFYSAQSRAELLGQGGYFEALAGSSQDTERQLLTKDNRVIETMLRAIPEKVGPGPPRGTRAIYTDITARKRMEKTLRKSRERLAEAQRLARMGSWEWDRASGRTAWSDSMYEIYGVDPETFSPSLPAALRLVHPEDRQTVRAHADRILSGGEPQPFEHRLVKPNGRVRSVYIEVRAELDAQGRPARLHGTTQDITERQRVEAKLQHSKERLRALAARLEAIREEERTTMAREIHDELGQALTGLKMDLSLLLVDPSDDPSSRGERLHDMLDLVDQTIVTVRELSSRLRPPVLDDLGLGDAIQWQANEFSRRAGIRCNVSVDSEVGTLDSERSTAIFRIFQEALTNVARHAEATSVDIKLGRSESLLLLEVTDDGKGIAEETPGLDRSLGLLGMRERAEGLGGFFEIGAGEAGGTRVSVSVPP